MSRRGQLRALRAGVAMSTALIVCVMPGPEAHAQALRAFCPSAQARLAKDPALAEAVAVSFGQPAFASSNEGECVYPYQRIEFDSAVALITLAGAPGEACHACTARISASVLRRQGSRLVLVKRFDEIGEAGSFGNPGKITPVKLAGDDGLLIASGGTWQGHTFIGADVYLFRAGRAVALKAQPELRLSYSNEGAVDKKAEIVSVDGRWRATGSEIEVSYEIFARGARRRDAATWTVIGDRLALTRGAPPKELEENR